MSDEAKKPDEKGAAKDAIDSLSPDTWVFTVDTITGRVMCISPSRKIMSDEVAIVLVNMNVLLGRVASMISQEPPPSDQAFRVNPKGGRQDN